MPVTLRTILLIDDDADIRQVAEIALKAVGGYQVQCCTSGAEGIASARMAMPDLILLDVMMGGMDGPATLAALRADALTDTIPVVFMTAKSQRSDIAQLRALGAIGVIAKPFDAMQLAAQVAELWRQQQSSM